MTNADAVAFWQDAHDRETRETAASREANRKACRERRDALRAAGLCIFDGERPAAQGSPLCGVCRERQAEKGRERYRAKLAELHGAGYTPRKYTRRKRRIGGAS